VDFAFAYGGPAGRAQLKSRPEDFRVTEHLGFSPEGQGEHVFLQIEKRGINTRDVVQRLAKLSGVHERDIGYSGLKDKQAVCLQWFSIYLAAKTEPDWQALEAEDLQICEVTRHARKLRIGVHRSNHFALTLRNCDLDSVLLQERLQRIREQGFPNYFGEQRFGRSGNNLQQARALFARTGNKSFKPRRKDSLLLSAARSWLFNQLLSHRVAHGSWHTAMAGEVFQFIDGKALFKDDDLGAAQQRLARGEISLTGPLWGSGDGLAAEDVATLEQHVVAADSDLLDGLQRAGLKRDRRALRANASDLNFDFDGNLLQIEFVLQRGVYATSLLREIVQTSFD
jgi:tRNA pseudouridine13 synthase